MVLGIACFRQVPADPATNIFATDRAMGWDLVEQGRLESPYQVHPTTPKVTLSPY